jgi:predicted DNA-binding transcriptional regulator YafY
MGKGIHETLVYRLPEMLTKLNQGQKIVPLDLAQEFSVSLRTVQRDLNVRFAYLPLQKIDGGYILDPSFLGKFNFEDVKHFAGLAGIKGLFPGFSDDILREIFDQRFEKSIMVKGHNYEDLSGKEELFKLLKGAIQESRFIEFNYKKQFEIKNYPAIEPYKLLNQKGIWYLVGKDGLKVKTFSIAKIQEVVISADTFSPDPSVQDKLSIEESIWFNGEKQEVVVSVSSEVAGYFKRRKLIANQVIEKELQDGSIIISAHVGHPNQILPIVRYWIPHLRIINPPNLQHALEEDLGKYIKP